MADVSGVKPKGQVWITRIFCERYGANVSKVEEVASDIAEKDPTFDYRIEKGDLVILSEDKDTAFCRGNWFIYNVDSRLERLANKGKKVYEVEWEEEKS